MNRLILIGNGFDLAHKIKTSYNDFILDYLKNTFMIARDHGLHKDIFLEVRQNHHFDEQLNINPYIISWKLEDFFGYISNDSSLGIDITGKPIRQKTYEYRIIIKNNLFSALINSCKDCNWVDIENEYYKILCDLSTKNQIKEITELNEGFKFLQDLLYNYLIKIEEQESLKNADISKSNLVNKLLEFIEHNAAPKIPQGIRVANDSQNIKRLSERKPKPNSILFLNFNYTSTIEKYIKDIQKKVSKTDVLYIHGKLKDNDNPIIFGYGDEEETNFEVLEKYDECLKYVKTYWYLRTANYEKFLSFINSDDFEVYIMGHSCGMSDKTMLSSIFNNEKCKKIKILTYDKSFGHKELAIDTTNYIEMTYQIGRLFKVKEDLRKKLISFNVKDLLKVDS